MFFALLGFLVGIQVAVADPGAKTSTEMRGIWVTRWTYDNAADVQQIMNDVADAGFNAVFFQVRGQHDAYYESSIEPWAARLTGKLGKNPGWDPLKLAVEVGHQRGLEVHAYINAFPLWKGDTPPISTPEHAIRTDPDWVVADDEGMPMADPETYQFASPGNSAVRERLQKVAADIDARYDVDGIHLDYLRYPGPKYGHDLASLAAWQDDGQPNFDDWRRLQVQEATVDVSKAVSSPVTAAVWGVYLNKWGWKDVSQGHRDYFQDSGALLQSGALDAVIPMIYWPVNPGGRLDFEELTRDHVSRAHGRHVYAGVRAKPEWGASQVISAIKASRRAGAHGVVIFEYSECKPWFAELKKEVFQTPAATPPMTWR
jgi:uncharacterized lipoprotein YddW (UPF0748 family)